MEYDKKSIGKRIAQLRSEHDINQSELAKAMNTTRSTVAKWELGERDLKTDTTAALADYFGTTCDYIIRNIATAENVDVHRETGLNDKSIDLLKRMDDLVYNLCEYGSAKDMFNLVFSGNSGFLEIIDKLLEYKETYVKYWAIKNKPPATDDPHQQESGNAELRYIAERLEFIEFKTKEMFGQLFDSTARQIKDEIENNTSYIERYWNRAETKHPD